MTQKEKNPFPFSDTNKRYFTYDYSLKKRFGCKVAKVSLDAGFSCPNIDGTCGVGGCIYCSEQGSGDFAGDRFQSITEQIEAQKSVLFDKWGKVNAYIAYFQAHTNTYAPVEKLKVKFEEAISQNGIVGLNIATRADCLPQEVTEYLSNLSNRTSLTVELGLQSIHDETAKRIRRGHNYAQFEEGFFRLREANPNIRICVHLIFGLPGESHEMILESVKKVAQLHPNEVKIHLLHILKHTEMANLFERGEYRPLEKEEYLNLLVEALELLPQDIVIGRVTGDGKKEDLLAPMWSTDKRRVLNDLDTLLFQKDTYQGKKSC